jgi:hypothetical protein
MQQRGMLGIMQHGKHRQVVSWVILRSCSQELC